MKKPLLTLVLAAGEGTRFRSETNKVLHPLLGRSMLRLVLDAGLSLKSEKTVVIVGCQKEAVMEEAAAAGIEFAYQKKRKGTAHAVMTAKSALKDGYDAVVMPADFPLIRSATLKSLVSFHQKRGNAATVLSADVENPAGFGRIVRGKDGRIQIVEEKDAGLPVRKLKEVNSGIYVFDVTALLGALPKISNRNKNGEYYLTDAISILSAAGKKVSIFKALNPEDIIQVNTRYDLSRAVNVLRERKIRELSENGVTVLNPSSTLIDLEAEIGRDTVVYPSVVIEGKTTIGERCCLYPGAHIINSRIGNRVSVFSSTVMVGATVEDEVIVGPFARLRPKTILRAGAHVGNFVEMKNTDFGRGSKAGHLSYLGDSEVGEGVNIGAGTITCNYDGVKKSRTVIEAGAFIGSGTQLVAPVKVGKGAYVAAGSVITKDVSPEALAVARGRQVERPGWTRRKREKQRKEKENRKT